MLGCENGHSSTSLFLLHKGADPDAMNHDGLTAIKIAKRNGYPRIAQSYLMKHFHSSLKTK